MNALGKYIPLVTAATMLLAFGCGPPPSPPLSKELILLKQAAEKGDAASQSLLGMRYAKGDGLPSNPELALKWFQAAAEKEDARGQAGLGYLYAMGEGVSKDYSQAQDWYLKAARQGYGKACVNLGFMHAHGQLGATNLVEARTWFRLADRLGLDIVQVNLTEIDKILTPEQIQESETKMQTFVTDNGFIEKPLPVMNNDTP